MEEHELSLNSEMELGRGGVQEACDQRLALCYGQLGTRES